MKQRSHSWLGGRSLTGFALGVVVTLGAWERDHTAAAQPPVPALSKDALAAKPATPDLDAEALGKSARSAVEQWLTAASCDDIRFIQRWASGKVEVSRDSTAARALGLDDSDRLSCEALPNERTRVFCVLDEGDDNLSADYTVALLETRSEGWVVLDTDDGTAQADEMKYEPQNSASLDWTLEQIARGKYAIAITADSESEGGWGPGVDDPGGHQQRVLTKWFAIDGEDLREIVSVESGGDSQLDYFGSFVEVSIDPTERTSNGYFILERTSTISEWGDDGGSLHAPKKTTATNTLRWDLSSRAYR